MRSTRFAPLAFTLTLAITVPAFALLFGCNDASKPATDSGQTSDATASSDFGEADGATVVNDSAAKFEDGGPESPCQIACRAPDDGPCAGEDPASCVKDCQANVAGVSAACADCLISRTGWYGQTCSCNSASDCCFSVFMPGEDDVTHCHAMVDCSESDYATQCLGYSVSAKLAPACAAACADSVGDAGI